MPHEETDVASPALESRIERGTAISLNLWRWNFSHLVKVRTRREVNLVNALEGYGPVEIVAPPEL